MSTTDSNGGARCERLLVVGLDCLAPALAFDRYLDRMPALRSLLAQGEWGELRSCDPPITVPAWMALATSRSPGSLGVYGFRHRRDHSYVDAWTVNGTTFSGVPALWDAVAHDGGRVCLVGLPPSYPPEPVNGCRVGCFLTPDVSRRFAYPATLMPRLLACVPDYRFDVTFRTDDREAVRRELYAMTQGHFDLVEQLYAAEPWRLFWLVEIGVDRVHHAFWKFADPDHRAYVAGHPFESVIADYYALVDERLGRLLELVDDDTAVLVVSDHGAKPMRGAIAVNQWLAEEGWLALEDGATAPGTPLERCEVDWSRTTAWAWGGYYARVFLNVTDREPDGVVPPERVDEVADELAEALRSIPDDEGRPLETRVLRPAEIYGTCHGDAPDLMVYFDDLSWRAAGTLGWDGVHLLENDTGPDDAVHAHEGCFVLRTPGRPARKLEQPISLLDVAPTLVTLLGLELPAEMEGEPCL